MADELGHWVLGLRSLKGLGDLYEAVHGINGSSLSVWLLKELLCCRVDPVLVHFARTASATTAERRQHRLAVDVVRVLDLCVRV